MSGVTRKVEQEIDAIKEVRTAPVEDKKKERPLRWHGQVQVQTF